MGCSSELGVGSTFWVELPGEQAAKQAEPATLPPAQVLDGLDGRDLHVLYVEDNRSNLDLVAEILRRVPGARLTQAATGPDGLAAALNAPPDLMLVDINLPGMDGFELFETLRKYPETADIPVIAVSAAAMAGQVERAREMGFADYVTKPYRMERLLEAIQAQIPAREKKI